MRCTCGNGRSSTRCGKVSSVYWPRWALCQLSSEGVAEPRMIGNVFQPGTHDRDIAGVIARRRFLLEGRFVFLVDDDQAEVARRREHRAACADDDLHAPGGDLPPVARPVGVLQMAMQHRDFAARALETHGWFAASG